MSVLRVHVYVIVSCLLVFMCMCTHVYVHVYMLVFTCVHARVYLCMWIAEDNQKYYAQKCHSFALRQVPYIPGVHQWSWAGWLISPSVSTCPDRYYRNPPQSQPFAWVLDIELWSSKHFIDWAVSLTPQSFFETKSYSTVQASLELTM